jgi:hypothetical protein
MPIAMPTSLAGGKTHTRIGHLFVLTDQYFRLMAVGVVGKDNQTATVSVVGAKEPTMILRARWSGQPPRAGEYVMSRVRPRSAYRIVETRITGTADDHVRLELVVERVSLPLPQGATVHPWRWDPRGKNAGHKSSYDSKSRRTLVPRHLELLKALVAFGDWARPSDLGGTGGSYHYASLTRLAAKGLVERRERARTDLLPPDRRSYEYRATQLGRDHA